MLVLEKGLDADLALLPFKPLAMKILQCSFLSGIRLGKVVPLLEKLQAKCILFPEDLRTAIDIPKAKPFSVVYYSENHTLRVPSLKRCAKLEISTDVASRFRWINLKEEDINITRLKGELSMEHGRHWLLLGPDSTEASIDLGRLSAVLQVMGINSSVEQAASGGVAGTLVLHVHEPSVALVEVKQTRTVISTSDKHLASCIFEAVDRVLCGV